MVQLNLLGFFPDLKFIFKNLILEICIILYNLDFEWHGSLIPDLLHVSTLHSNMLAFAPGLSIYLKNQELKIHYFIQFKFLIT